jgi:bacillithiol synthase
MATDIPFSVFPDQSRLFLGYMDLSPDVRPFYNLPPSMEALAAFAGDAISSRRFPRKEIASILRRQNTGWGCDGQTRKSIDKLEEPDSVAILTGQQVGLFTGPLYTIYKALTAIRLAGELQQLNGINAVPLFWMETEDHDLQEAVKRTVPLSSPTDHLDYRKALFGRSTTFRQPVGSLQFQESIRTVIDDYFHHLPASKWKAAVRKQLESAYRPGATFGGSFARFMHYLLKGTGIILFDPADREAKQLASGVFTTAIHDAKDLYDAIAGRDRELDAAGFHRQVTTRKNSTLLFIMSEGRRCALKQQDDGFSVRTEGTAFDTNELLNRARHAPQQFSPNVLLRPIVQDHLFPTAAYVGGPAEIAYFAQAEILYRHFDRPMPVIWPRNSFTLVDQRTGAVIKQLGLDITDCIKGNLASGGNFQGDRKEARAAATLDELQEKIERVFADIRPKIDAVSPPLVSSMEKTRRKILHNSERLRSQLARAGKEGDPRTREMLERIFSICRPGGSLQERELGICYFLSCHGMRVIDEIRSDTTPGRFAHRALYLHDSEGTTGEVTE